MFDKGIKTRRVKRGLDVYTSVEMTWEFACDDIHEFFGEIGRIRKTSRGFNAQCRPGSIYETQKRTFKTRKAAIAWLIEARNDSWWEARERVLSEKGMDSPEWAEKYSEYVAR